MNDCSHYLLASEIPAPIHPGTQPESWDEDRPAVDTRIFYDTYFCSRMGWGDRDYVGAAIVIESHNNYRTRNNCTSQDDASLATIATRIFASPPELSVDLAAVVGSVAIKATIARNETAVQSVEDLVISFGVKSHNASRFSLTHVDDNINGEFRVNDQYLFETGGMIRLRTLNTEKSPILFTPARVASFHWPTMMAGLGLEEWPSRTALYPRGSGEIHFQIFEDQLCEKLSYSTL